MGYYRPFDYSQLLQYIASKSSATYYSKTTTSSGATKTYSFAKPSDDSKWLMFVYANADDSDSESWIRIEYADDNESHPIAVCRGGNGEIGVWACGIVDKIKYFKATYHNASASSKYLYTAYTRIKFE